MKIDAAELEEQRIVLDFREKLFHSLGLQHSSKPGPGCWPLGAPVMGDQAKQLWFL